MSHEVDPAVEQLSDERALEEESPREPSPNPTQKRLDEESGEKPVDVGWEGNAPGA